MFGFYRVATAIPRVYLGDVERNSENIIAIFEQACEKNSAVVVFPELSLTGYSCGDLFFQKRLLESVEAQVEKIVKATKNRDTILIFGLPLKFQDSLFNVAIAIQAGKILAVIPKHNRPNYKEFSEKRFFSSGSRINNQEIMFAGEKVLFSKDLIFANSDDFVFGIEICEDLWSIIPPSAAQLQAGAKLICNLSASTEYVNKNRMRVNLIREYSSKGSCAYAFASAGVGESVSDSVHAGHAVIAENGKINVANEPFIRENQLYFSDIDFEKLSFTRMVETSFNDKFNNSITQIKLDKVAKIKDLEYANISKNPFLGDSEYENELICSEILEIQANALASRVDHINAKTMLIGISGGLDSTLALLVCCKACEILNRPASDVIAVTMPGFGTSNRTYYNAVDLCKNLGVTLKEISIKEATLQHFKDIEHDPNTIDVTYENAQARERTQILMDLANKNNGIVVGTGDLSEIALGWCTYNGDHMSMYSVNASIPKTLMRYIITSIANKSSETLKRILIDIVDTPVSPELLPSSEGSESGQKTEEIIGPYELHDFFIYHFIKSGATPEKLIYMATKVFENVYSTEMIEKTFNVFVRRFFSQQFKRNCTPDGPKCTNVSLSPRGDWKMASEFSSALWR